MKPLMGIILVQLVIIYTFSTVGMFIFGGLVTKETLNIKLESSVPFRYYLLNFNDQASSFITLYSLMVVNNW